jgi:hypothetical protein
MPLTVRPCHVHCRFLLLLHQDHDDDDGDHYDEHDDHDRDDDGDQQLVISLAFAVAALPEVRVVAGRRGGRRAGRVEVERRRCC